VKKKEKTEKRTIKAAGRSIIESYEFCNSLVQAFSLHLSSDTDDNKQLINKAITMVSRETIVMV